MSNTILAVDPGLRAMGVAVLGRRDHLRFAMVLGAPRNGPLNARLRTLGHRVDEILGLYSPRVMVLEATWPSRNDSIARLHRVAMLCKRRARNQRIGTVSIPSGTVRRLILGDGNGSKRDIARVVSAHYPELRPYFYRDRSWREKHFQNLFDAVAIALAYRRIAGSAH
jgi:Holliday junction resolvasome RuvABC endonuclease subunit